MFDEGELDGEEEREGKEGRERGKVRGGKREMKTQLSFLSSGFL